MSETQPDQGWTKNGQPQAPEPVIQPTVRAVWTPCATCFGAGRGFCERDKTCWGEA